MANNSNKRVVTKNTGNKTSRSSAKSTKGTQNRKKTSTAKKKTDSKKVVKNERKGKGTNVKSKKSNLREVPKTRARKAPSQRNVQQKININNMEEKRGIPLQSDVMFIAAFGLMIIMTISNFGVCGPAGNGLRDLFFAIFGCVQYIMPIALFIGVALLIANDNSYLAIKKCAAGFTFLMMISALAQIFYSGRNLTIMDLTTLAVSNHATGGIIGGTVGLLLKGGFGVYGASIIVLCIMIISLIIVTQKSLAQFVKEMVQKLKASMRESASDRQIRKARFGKNPTYDQYDPASFEMPEESMQDYPDYYEESEIYPQELVEESAPKKTKQNQKKQVQEEVVPEPKVKAVKPEKLKPEKPHRSRAEACDEVLKELEEQGDTATTEEPQDTLLDDIKINIPVFVASDDIKKEENVRELEENVYPLSEEDRNIMQIGNKMELKAVDFNEGPSDKAEREIEVPIEEISMESMEIKPVPVQEPVVHESSKEDVEIIEAQDIGNDAVPEDLQNELSSELPQNTEHDVDKKHTDRKNSATKSSSVVAKESIAKEPMKASTAKASIVSEVIPEKKIVPAKKEEYIFPPLSLLKKSNQKLSAGFEQELKKTAKLLQQTLASFGVNVTITDISCGPTVTRYEMFPEQGTKVSKILNLTDDIKLNLAAADIRIEAPIPGKAAIGIEVPNKESVTVHFRDMIENPTFKGYKSKLAFAVGKDIGGKTIVTDLAKMPHLLIAGATGSGKSVCINTLIMSILYKATPQDVKLIMIDPKMVELSVYNGIPHLLIPVVTDAKKASGALNWAVAEMTNRYNKFAECHVRNIEGYNQKIADLEKKGEIEPGSLEKMPKIVIIIDELADLMMVAPGEVEDAIVRLSQLARAAGIHLVIATQRPSVNVITGLIKANIPSRIAFSVSSGVDSRTIIDMNGAEKLLGKGDMLFYPSGYQKPVRMQCAFVSDEEVTDVVEFLKDNEEVAVYDTKVEESIAHTIQSKTVAEDRDEYFEAAARFFIEKDKATIGMLQRMFKIGFNRAARIVDQLAEAGIVGPEEGTKPRKILMSPEQLEQYFEDYL